MQTALVGFSLDTQHKLYGYVKLTKQSKSTKAADMKASFSAKPRPGARKRAAPAAEDHRVRTGAARSEQTRLRLLVAALTVFAEKGTDAPVIDDFIAAAQVARGTFYNYFSTTQALLAAVTAELSDEILSSIDVAVLKFDDPVERIVCGCLLYMHLAVEYPTWGVFMTRSGLRIDAVGKLVDVYLPRDLQLALDAGLLAFPSVRVARDLVFGCTMQSIASGLSGAAPREHLREAFQLALRGMGVAPRRASQLCAMHLPEIELPHGLVFSRLQPAHAG